MKTISNILYHSVLFIQLCLLKISGKDKEENEESIYNKPVTFRHIFPEDYKPDTEGFNNWTSYTHKLLNN